MNAAIASISRCALLAAALFMIGAPRAQAATCTVVATGVAFGAYTPTSSTNVTGLGNVQVTCAALVVGVASYTIALSAGSGSFANRTLTSSPYTLQYNLYTDTTRTFVWGDGTFGTSTVSDSYGILLLPVTRNYPVYGLIPGSQTSAGAGLYSDSVTVTVTF